MKFGRAYKDHLLNDGYPPEWIDSAISYGKLKKCIKRVQKELSDIGLDIDTLHRLLKSVESNNDRVENAPIPVKYSLNDGTETLIEDSLTRRPFHPKLLIALDDETGEPLDMGLAPETLDYLRKLSVEQQLGDLFLEKEESRDQASLDCPDDQSDSSSRRRASTTHRVVEIALTSDSEFFDMLQRELTALDNLQSQQQTSLTTQVHTLGPEIAKVSQPGGKFSKTDLAAWRRIFELYLSSNIFFATGEIDHGTHDFSKAQKNYQFFTQELTKSNIPSQFRKKESAVLLQNFMRLNNDLLMAQHFRELNSLAATKILKKFDKRTALPVRAVNLSLTPTKSISSSPFSSDISKAICAQMSTHILALIPQLDDFSCPICCDITWQPVRLACSHVFCIRCLIILQKEHKDRCPLCRENSVGIADADNIDEERKAFLKRWFREEVRGKQKANERAAAIEQFGEQFVNGGKGDCVVM